MRLTIVDDRCIPQLSHAELGKIVAAALPLIDKTKPSLARQDTDDNEINSHLALIEFFINAQNFDLQTELAKFMADLSPEQEIFYQIIAASNDFNQKIEFWHNQDQLESVIKEHIKNASTADVQATRLDDASESPRGVIQQAVNLYQTKHQSKTKQELSVLKHRSLMQAVKKCMNNVVYDKDMKEISLSVYSHDLSILMHNWVSQFNKIKDGSTNKNTNEIIFETMTLYRAQQQAIILQFMNRLNLLNAMSQLALIHRVAHFCLELRKYNEQEATDSGLATLFQANFFAMLGLRYSEKTIQSIGLKNIAFFNSSLFICFIELGRAGRLWFETSYLPDLYHKEDTPRPRNNNLLSRSVSVASILPKFSILTFSSRRYRSEEDIHLAKGDNDKPRQRAHTVTLLRKKK